jgi:SAM-dependent methyltransferase
MPVTSREPERPALPLIEAIAALDSGILGALREALVRCGYSENVVFEAERVAPAQLDAVRLPLVHWWLERRGDPAALLALVFEYGGCAPARDVGRALGGDLSEALLAAGVLEEREGEVRARLRLTPLLDLFLLSDPPESGAEAVMGPGPTTVMLARLIPASPGAVLDLGCGAGTLALVAAARGASRAVGVDVSPRAVTLAGVNARLNGRTAEFRQGDTLDPVRGESFDLAVSQPPYVVRPAGLSPTTYLHGGARGEELALRFAEALPAALREGGRALLFFDAIDGGEPLHQRLRRALGRAAVDLVVLAAPGPSPDLQAVGYASLEDRALGRAYGEAVKRYRNHLAALGATAFSRTLVVLSASPVPGGRFDVELPVAGLGGVDGAALDAYLAALQLAATPDVALLRVPARPAPGTRLREEHPADAPTAPPVRSIRFDRGGLGSDREISDTGAFLIETLAKAATIEEAAARFAEACGAGRAEARSKLVDFVREGLSRGLLVPG